jgi:CBS domain-containing protein
LTDAPAPESVADLMTPDPAVVWPDTPLAEVAALLDSRDISGVPVVDWNGWLVGVVTRIDLIRVRESPDRWAAWPELAARNAMTSDPVTVEAGASIEEAARLLDEHRIHRLVVVDSDGLTPVGVLSATDLVRAMAERGGGAPAPG